MLYMQHLAKNKNGVSVITLVSICIMLSFFMIKSMINHLISSLIPLLEQLITDSVIFKCLI